MKSFIFINLFILFVYSVRSGNIKLKCVDVHSCSGHVIEFIGNCYTECYIQNITTNKDDVVTYVVDADIKNENDEYGENDENGEYDNVYNNYGESRRENERNINNKYLSIEFANSKIYSIPNDTFSKMENIYAFNASFVGIEKIYENTFRLANNLRYLNLSHNHLTDLPPYMLSNSKYVEHIDLSHNQLTEIHSAVFANVDQIKFLFFSYNRIERLEAGVFDHLDQLYRVYLDHNQIKSIDSTLFIMNHQLLYIELSSNQIETIICTTFVRYNNQRNLYLDNNPIQKIYENLTKIEKRRESDHRIASFLDVPNIYLSNTSAISILGNEKYSIKEMTMNDSIANNLHLFLRHFEELRYLSLINTKIGSLNITTFSKQTELSTLYLRNCSLDHLTYGTFAHQTKLELLDISYNNLMRIDFHMFLPALGQIRELYIDGNNLTEINNLTTKNFVSLSVLGISDNNFQCFYLLHKVLELEKIEIKIDGDSAELNITHVKGVSCTHNESFLEEYKAEINQSNQNQIHHHSNSNITHLNVTNVKVNHIHQNEKSRSQWIFEILVIAICSAVMTYNATVYWIKRKNKQIRSESTINGDSLLLFHNI